MSSGYSQQPPQQTDKEKWIQKMLRSARTYHKLCPYFDKKTKQCFIKLGEECDRDGKYDTCPVFMDFLASKYEEYISKGRMLPTDFLDITH